MSLRSRIATALQAGLGGALGAFGDLPVVRGIGRTFTTPYALPKDQGAQRAVESRDALYGRVAYNLGPVQNNISTHPLRGLTPERVSSILDQVYVTGWMVDWACLVEDLVRFDSQIHTLHQSGTEAVTGAPFAIEPADPSPEARAIADFQQSIVDSLSDWPRAMGRLLLGNAMGYALEEAVYEDREVEVTYGGSSVSVRAPIPSGFAPVHNKHTRWDVGQGNQLLLDVGGRFIQPPAWKFLRYEASDPGEVRNRGWAPAAVWLSLIKQNAWARWGVLLDIWGLRAPVGKASETLWQDLVRRSEMLSALRDFGRGLPSLFTDDFSIEASAGIPDGDARGMHAASIGAINLELSKLIIGSTLTTEVSGTGSYNASETHASTKEARVRGWERNLSACVREWLRAALKLAIYEFQPDDSLETEGSFGAVRADGICGRLGIPPERALALCGIPTWRVMRESTPESRMGLFKSAVNELGLDVDQDQIYREFGLIKSRNPEKRVPGKPVPVAADAATVSTTDAVRGVENPKDDPAPKTELRKRGPRGRFAKRNAA